MDIKLLFELLKIQFNTIYFMIGFILILSNLVIALLYIGLAKVYIDEINFKIWVKRWIGCIISYIFLLILSLIPEIKVIICLSIIPIYLICIRDITILLKFTGIDLSSLTFFIDLLLNFIHKKGIKIFLKKDNNINN